MTRHKLLSYIFLLLLTAACFSSKVDDANSQITNTNEDEEGSQVANSSVVPDQPGQPDPKAGKVGAGTKSAPGEVAKTADKIVEYIMYTALVVTGFYVCFSGFKTFRLTMVILGFYVSYYVILFTLTENEVYKGDNVGHQLGLFFGSLVLGFIISVLCYIFDRANFIIFGTAVACMVGLVQTQLLIDIRNPEDATLFLIIFIACATIFSIIAFFVLDHFIIWGFAFVGGVVVPVNLAVMFQMMTPFENRAQGESPDSRVIIPVISAIGIMTMLGIGAQYWLRRRLIKKWTDDGDEENPRQTFLDDKF